MNEWRHPKSICLLPVTRPASAPPKDGARVYFGADPLAAVEQPITPWAPGEAPVVMASRMSGDPDIKQSALAPPQQGGDDRAGETIASKGEVTGVGQRPKSPAERLALTGASRAKAEKCLANAIYFEARGEAGARANCRGASRDESGVLAVLPE